jgi:hypothetical protein
MLVAQEAARILAKEGRKDYLVAKTKAAERLGVDPKAGLPTNIEVEQALMQHQSLFLEKTHQPMLNDLRASAMEAMQMLDRFNPRLVGPVLAGTAGENSEINLHLFADSVKHVVMFLMEQNIPYEAGEKRYRFGKEYQYLPVLRFFAGEMPFELSVFPPEGIRQAPVSPVDGRPMKRASLRELEQLMAAN